MTITEAKKKYNEFLKRFNKANEYFEDESIPNSVKEKQLENFDIVLKGLNYHLSKIEIYTSQECMKGFK